MTVLPRPAASADAVVLRTWPTGETSVIASTVTAEHGFVRLIAKGARNERSVLRPLVQPGRLVNAEFSLRPDRELQYLKGGQVLLDPAAADPGLERTAYLLAALELLDRCRPGGERDGRVFPLCRNFLGMLSSSSPGDAGLFYALELNLLDLHGVTPEIGGCAQCGDDVAPDDAGGARFCGAAGGVVCRRCAAEGHGAGGRPLSRAALGVLRGVSAGEAAAYAQVGAEPSLRREVGIHLHGFLAYHVPTYRLPAALELLRPPAAQAADPADRKDEPR
ncbi:MAG TPA: DNA repair protein RecO [Candidatus Krumholzibacteria bacterium]|nr:DNA repair protein RecO [Candidatus Krumholzibacteria bacterium]HRX51115.1 DNA repair protein RecO [Candidatus Krumholzibacteria bacterium]